MAPQINYAKVGSGITGVGSIYANYMSGMAQAESYMAQSRAYTAKASALKTDQFKARLMGKQTALRLNTVFNESMANHAVMTAAQHRRGGSAEAIAKASETQYNWDLDYSEMASQIEIKGLKAQEYGAISASYGAERASRQAKKYATISAGLGAVGLATSLLTI